MEMDHATLDGNQEDNGSCNMQEIHQHGCNIFPPDSELSGGHTTVQAYDSHDIHVGPRIYISMHSSENLENIYHLLNRLGVHNVTIKTEKDSWSNSLKQETSYRSLEESSSSRTFERQSDYESSQCNQFCMDPWRDNPNQIASIDNSQSRQSCKDLLTETATQVKSSKISEFRQSWEEPHKCSTYEIIPSTNSQYMQPGVNSLCGSLNQMKLCTSISNYEEDWKERLKECKVLNAECQLEPGFLASYSEGSEEMWKYEADIEGNDGENKSHVSGNIEQTKLTETLKEYSKSLQNWIFSDKSEVQESTNTSSQADISTLKQETSSNKSHPTNLSLFSKTSNRLKTEKNKEENKFICYELQKKQSLENKIRTFWKKMKENYIMEGSFLVSIIPGTFYKSSCGYHVEMSSGTNYKVELGNFLHCDCNVDLKIDGQLVACLRLASQVRVRLDSPMNSTERFIFMRAHDAFTPKIGVIQSQERNGLIEVRFQPGYIHIVDEAKTGNTYCPQGKLQGVPSSNDIKWCSGEIAFQQNQKEKIFMKDNEMKVDEAKEVVMFVQLIAKENDTTVRGQKKRTCPLSTKWPPPLLR